MIESEADQVPDDVMYEGIVQAHAHLQPVLDLIDKMVSEIGKPKFEYEHHDIDHDLFDKLEAACIKTIESGKMTKDLALITTIENPTVLNSEGFIKAIREELEKTI